MGNQKQTGDDEWVEKVAILGGVAIVIALVLFCLPVLIAGFLIGLFWYSAYIKDHPSYGRMAWPVILILSAFVYFIGLPGKLHVHFEGMLLSDFKDWTVALANDIVCPVVESLTLKMQKKLGPNPVTATGLRNYLWLTILVASSIFGALRYKTPTMRPRLYDFAMLLTAPFRGLASNFLWFFAGFLIVGLTLHFLDAPSWLELLYAHVLNFTFFYGLIERIRKGTLHIIGFGSFMMGFNEKPKVGTIDVGRDAFNGRKVIIGDAQLNHHVHIVGASGFGKSVLLSHILRNRIESGHGLLFIDLKTDIATITQIVSVAKACGRENDLQIFSSENPDLSMSYNILANGSANQLKDRIMGALNWSEEFYKNEAQSFLIHALQPLVYLRDRENQSFDLKTILDLLCRSESVVSLLKSIPLTEPDLAAQTRELGSYLARPENLKNLRGLKSQLEGLLMSDFGKLLKTSSRNDGIDLFDAVQKKRIVFVLLDSRTYGETAHSLGKIILQDLKAMSAKIDRTIEKEDRIPFSVIVDEFADLATEDFVGFLDRARSSKIGVVVAHQEIADLDRVDPTFTKRLMNSTSTLFAFLQKLPDSSELIAGISGTKKVNEVTEQAQSSIFGFGDVKTGMKSIKVVDEFNIHPNVVRSLSVGQCVVIEKYPHASSQIVNIRPEVKADYIETGKEVRSILSRIKAKVQESAEMIRPNRFRPQPEPELKQDVNQTEF